MKPAITTFVWLAVSAPAYAAEGTSTWGCAPIGERQKVLILADRGSRSYVKFSGQRITATAGATDAGKSWSFGGNEIVLTADGIAEYYERGALKARFKCKPMN